ncbi:hypothetical protein XELAEV_18026452mg [Xenopus laevis]|uniref:Uncharacterized protein n=1 Tax=Xenopus laevis TaxID=8355 RepID=A0A974CTS6_XENLA|nr:hypothetical protein XELAEV_18026452mg [Xenopus laevis]
MDIVVSHKEDKCIPENESKNDMAHEGQSEEYVPPLNDMKDKIKHLEDDLGEKKETIARLHRNLASLRNFHQKASSTSKREKK